MEKLWKELFKAIEERQWEIATKTFELLIQQFFYPRDVPDIFKELPDIEILQAMMDVELLRFRAGQTIMRESDRSDSLFIIVNGTVEVSAKNKWTDSCAIPLPCVLADKVLSRFVHGDEVLIAQLSNGDIFGEMALIISQPRTATATAQTDVELITIKRAENYSHQIGARLLFYMKALGFHSSLKPLVMRAR